MNHQLSTLWYFIRPYWRRYSLIAVFNVLLGATEYLTLALLMPLLSHLGGSTSLHAGWLQRFLDSLIALMPFRDPITAIGGLIVISGFIRFAVNLVQQWLVTQTSGQIMTTLRKRIFRHFADLNLDSLLTQKQGRLVYILGTSPNKVASALMRLPYLTGSVVSSLSILFLLLTVHWKLTVILIVISGVFYTLVSYYTRRRGYQLGRLTTQTMSEANVTLNEFVTGIKQITVNNAVDRWVSVSDQSSERISDLYSKMNRVMEYPRFFLDLFSILCVVGILAGAEHQLGSRLNTLLPTLGIFLAGFLRLIPQISNIGNANVLIASSLSDFEIVRDILQTKPSPRPLRAHIQGHLEEAIRFDGVSFGHQDRPVLFESLSFSIPRHKTTALVGKSGQGKTSIVNLLLGLYVPKGGAIRVDQSDLQDIDLKSWRAKIGFVSQDAFIFHGTIRENITLMDSNTSASEVEEAARAAHAHEFIEQLPMGYESIVGERGMKLSGGQQQRIAIARAVLRKPDLYIFDEATSSLDPVSERAVQEAMTSLSKGHTTFIVTHRLSTVRHADNILVLHEGSIVEQGTHDSLLSLDRRYKELFEVNRT